MKITLWTQLLRQSDRRTLRYAYDFVVIGMVSLQLNC
jgi:hypothetical protein